MANAAVLLCVMDGCGKARLAKGFCSMHYRRNRINGDPSIQGNPRDAGTPEERFHAKTIPVTESGCWLWTGAAINTGYGMFYPKHGEGVLAHRYSYSLKNGPIPCGMHCCHKCDTPSCVNPDHLFLGSAAENMRDASRKGRLNTPRGAKGSSHRCSKLNNRHVKEIRESSEPLRVFAALHGMTISAVSRVRRRETYKDVA